MTKLFSVVAVIALFFVTGGSTGGKIYIYADLKLNWYEAYEHCRTFDKSLLTITCPQKNDRVMSAIQSCGQQCGHTLDHVWTSGSDLPHDGSFVWMGNGQPFSFTSWNNGEPSNKGQEDCVAIWDIRDGRMPWNDKPCSDLYYVICEDLN